MTFETNAAAHRRRIGQESHDRQCGERLARPGLADDAKSTAGLKIERDAIDHTFVTKHDDKIPYLEETHDSLRRKVGSSDSRRPSPVRLKPSTAITITSPGHNAKIGSTIRYCCDSANMRPHDGVGGNVPSPR